MKKLLLITLCMAFAFKFFSQKENLTKNVQEFIKSKPKNYYKKTIR